MVVSVSPRIDFVIIARIVVVSVCLLSGGCSFNLSSLSPGSDKNEPISATPALITNTTLPDVANKTDAGTTDAKAAQVYSTKGQTLVQSGKTTEAFAAFDAALALDPHNAQAFYNRGLLYQSEKQYEQAIADFTSANGLTPQQPDPLIGRAQSFIALGKTKEAAIDLDEAVQLAPQNPQAWSSRGIAYERIGDRTKAADSYSRAIGLRPRDDIARNGLARVSGRSG